MRSVQLGLVAAFATVIIAGCGGSSAPPAGQTQAAAACKSGGAAAASLANQAAALNPRFATLSVDESAAAASESTTESELNDGNSSDDSGLGAIAGANNIGSTSSLKIVSDCVKLGLSVTPH